MTPADRIAAVCKALADAMVPLCTNRRQNEIRTEILAIPGPAAGPTDEEIIAFWSEHCAGDGDAGILRLARYCHQPPQPIPLSERLPGAEDCDDIGRCWWISFDQQWFAAWVCDSVRPQRATHWLPHHALPLPETP